MDVPAILFVRDFLLAYPEAKVMLNNREIDGWYKSMSKTVLRVLSWRFIGPSKPTYDFFRQACTILFQDNWSPESIKSSYRLHYQQVRKLVPKDRLLEVNLGDGWKPMCQFLDVPIPAEPYPTAYNSQEFLEFHRKIWWSDLRAQLLRWAGTIGLPIMVLGFAIAYTTTKKSS